MGTPAEKWEALDQLAGFQNELAAMRKVLEEVKYELLTVKKENEEQKRRILELEDRVDYQENQSRRDNLVIRGIPESKGETRERKQKRYSTFSVVHFAEVEIEPS